MKLATRFVLASALALSVLPLPPVKAAPTPSSPVKLIREMQGVKEFHLPNQLKVLLVENHAAPVATVMVVYRVGSRNEAVGYTGSTHFLEHMLFKGTEQYNKAKGTQIANTLMTQGARFNATTWLDRTNYFETLPAAQLELALKIEADRMRHALIEDKERQSEMRVVRNEMERGENSPERIMWLQLFAHAFMAHPYHHPTIGWRSDVEGVPTDRLKTFYDDFYHPNNATLIVVGDMNSSQTLQWIETYFGQIPASKKPIPPMYTTEPPQQGERRFKLKRPGQVALVRMGYHVPPLEHRDSVALEVLQTILGSGPSSRLYRDLVEKQIASASSASNIQLRDPGLFIVSADALSKVTPEQAEKALQQVINTSQQTPPSAQELHKAKAQLKADFARSRHGTMQLANLLGEYEASAEWRYAMTYLARLETVSAAEVQAVAKKYLQEDNRTVGYFIPQKSQEFMIDERHPEVYDSKASQTASVKAAAPAKTEIKRLSIGPNAALLVQENHLDNTVSLQLSLMAGSIYDPPGKTGLADLTSKLLVRGTNKRTYQQLVEELELLGSGLSAQPELERLNIGMPALSENLPQTLAILFEVLTQPAFPQAELDKLKKQMSDGLRRELENTDTLAAEQMYQSLYPVGHPYRPASIPEQIKSLENITLADIKAFYKQHYGSNRLIAAVVGDIQTPAIEAAFKKALGAWNPQNPVSVDIPDTALQAQGQQRIKTMTDKANVSIAMGHQAPLKLSSVDYFPAMLANLVLGQSTLSSRLGLRVRDELGLTYGISSTFPNTGLGAGPWMVNVTTNPVNVDKTIAAAKEVIAKYRQEGISTTELAQAKSAMIGQYLVSLSTNPEIASRLRQIEFYGLGQDYIQRRAQLIQQVTLAQVNQAIRKYFQPDRFTTVIVGNYPNK